MLQKVKLEVSPTFQQPFPFHQLLHSLNPRISRKQSSEVQKSLLPSCALLQWEQGPRIPSGTSETDVWVAELKPQPDPCLGPELPSTQGTKRCSQAQELQKESPSCLEIPATKVPLPAPELKYDPGYFDTSSAQCTELALGKEPLVEKEKVCYMQISLHSSQHDFLTLKVAQTTFNN